MRLLEFSRQFTCEEDCENFLKEHREKNGMVCPKCGCKKMYWDKCHKRWVCSKCRKEVTLRSGTVMHGSNLPLMYWFTAIHLLTSTKKTFSALEMQRQLGHKRYQPIWEMMHKLRSVMGQRDTQYKLTDTIELDEGYFTTESSDSQEKSEKLKRGVGSQRKSKVLVMVESKETDGNSNTKKGRPSRKCGHLKMKVLEDLTSSTFEKEVKESVNGKATVVMDALPAHSGVEKVVAETVQQVVPGKDAPKVLPWVHIAISNAKSLFADIYHGIKDEYLQEYLNEFCYKFNRRYFGERLFDRLIEASISYRPGFEHRLYNSNPPVCG